MAMKTQFDFVDDSARADVLRSEPSLFCGATDPETNARLHPPTAVTTHKTDKSLDLDDVRSAM